MGLVQPRIFISHSSTDLPFVRKLADDLQHALGNKEAVWYDSHLEGGEQWWRKIVEELRRSTVCLIICSPAAMASDWVNDEIDLAWRLKNSQVKMRLIPLLYRPCQLRYELENLQFVHFLAPRPYQKALQELLQTLSISPESPEQSVSETQPEPEAGKDQMRPNLHRPSLIPPALPSPLSSPSGNALSSGRTRRPNPAPPSSVHPSFFRGFPLASLLVRSRSAQVFLFIALLLLVLASGVFTTMMLSPSRSPSQSYSQATDHSPVFIDPLQDNRSGHSWLERDNDGYGSCFFKGGAYHVTAQPGDYHSCGAAMFPLLQDFAFQGEVIIVSGTGGGFDFRFTPHNNGYLFYILEDGTYTVVREVGQNNMTQNIILQHAFSSAINTHPRESNLLAILARGTTFDLYVNTHYVTSFSDNTYSRGDVENLAVSNSSNDWTDVVFRNVKAWAI